MALRKLQCRFKKNGYRNFNCKQILNNKKDVTRKETEHVFLQTNFINDRFNEKVNKIIGQYNFPVKVVSKPNKNLSQLFRADHNKNSKHDHCTICHLLHENYNCSDRFIVYKFTCQTCHKFYIGETCRPFKQRFDEHNRSLQARDTKSALAEHMKSDHPSIVSDIQNFDLCVLASQRTSIETRIKEAQFIQKLRPQLNRRVEMSNW